MYVEDECCHYFCKVSSILALSHNVISIGMDLRPDLIRGHLEILCI
jgi:hypothetical protein